MVHTLRYVLGDEAFFTLLRRIPYPDPSREKLTDGSQCHFVSTEDVIRLAEELVERDLSWFWEVYLRQPALPRLEHSIRDGVVSLKWDVPDGRSFPMPVEIRIGDRIERVEMPGGRATVPEGVEYVLDPNHWILRAER